MDREQSGRHGALIDLKVDGLITDYPNLAKPVIAGKGLKVQ